MFTVELCLFLFFFFSSRRRHTRLVSDWSSDVCSSDLNDPITILTAVYVRDGDWIVAWLEELPGVATQGATLEEARDNLRDALQLTIEIGRASCRERV